MKQWCKDRSQRPEVKFRNNITSARRYFKRKYPDNYKLKFKEHLQNKIKRVTKDHEKTIVEEFCKKLNK